MGLDMYLTRKHNVLNQRGGDVLEKGERHS